MKKYEAMSKKHLDQIVVVDLEATCWETEVEEREALEKINEEKKKRGEAPVKRPSEIIEIGVCLYEVERQRAWFPICSKCLGGVKEDCLVCQGKGVVGSIVVKPEYSKINDFCTRLTSITPEFVKKYGLDFPSACNRLRKYFGPKTRIWAAWGDYDRRMFSDQCNYTGERYPFSATYWNIKSIHGIKNKLRREVGLGSAVRSSGMEFEGTAHRVIDDAYNAARILGTLF